MEEHCKMMAKAFFSPKPTEVVEALPIKGLKGKVKICISDKTHQLLNEICVLTKLDADELITDFCLHIANNLIKKNYEEVQKPWLKQVRDYLQFSSTRRREKKSKL